jgi:hypothetical protein
MTRIAFAVFIGAVLAGTGTYAACPPNPAKPTLPKSHHAKPRSPADNCVNLSTLPQISNTIVTAEPAPAVTAPAHNDPAVPKYEGPTLGLTKPDPGVRAIPTIGYHWSLE